VLQKAANVINPVMLLDAVFVVLSGEAIKRLIHLISLTLFHMEQEL
jgi:hypothetical protein